VNKLPQLHDQLYSYDNVIVCVTETFLHSGISNGLLDPKHLYTIIRKDRSSGKGGGVCRFVNQNILICQLPLPEIYADLEMLCFDIVNLVPPVRYFLFTGLPTLMSVLFNICVLSSSAWNCLLLANI